MPQRRPSKPTGRTPNTLTDPQKSSPKTPSIPLRQRISTLLHDEKTTYIIGLLLLIVTLYIGLACISYLFTGEEDYSVLTANYDEQDIAVRHTYTNWTGPLGARIAHAFMDGGFGLSIFVIIYALTIISLRLMRATRKPILKTVFHSAFWLIWSSVFIGFTCQPIYKNSFFRWGGKHGQAVTNYLTSYIEAYGMILLLAGTLIIYFIVTNPNTIPTIKRGWAWFVALFKRKPKPEPQPEQEPEPTDTADMPDVLDPTDLSDPADLSDLLDDTNSETADDTIPYIDLTDTDTDSDTDKPEEKDEQPFDDDNFVIENNADDIVDSASTPDSATDTLTDTDEEEIDIEIEEPTDTETVSKNLTLLEKLGPYDPRKDLEFFEFPPLDLLKTYPNETSPQIDMDEQRANKDRIVNTLRSYGVEIETIRATIGPTITLYEIVPKEGTRINKIKNLENDIMLSLAATGIRIIAPIPGKGTIGIEVPNEKPQIVSMHSVIASRKFQEEAKMALPVALGRTITNEVFMFDLAKTPHLLVAGATGQGKSVGLNAIITSLLYKKHPAELKFVLVDPKMVEFNMYGAIEKDYLAEMPDQEEAIITDSTKVVSTLNSLVIEMENRYELLMKARCRNIIEYNQKFINRELNPENGHRYLPYIVIIIDEFGDFIMVAGKEVEMPIARITQKARAVGMHMILATQRPSVNIITGIIKANVPARIAFRVQSMIDSRTILDSKGAEQLVGKGDLLYSAGQEPTRIQCAFVDTPEVEQLVEYISKQQAYTEPYQLPEYVPEGGEDGGALAPGAVDLKKLDPMFKDVATFVVSQQQGSTSVLQRKFQIGYNRAGKLSDQLEAAGIIGPNNGPKGRTVLIQDEVSLARILEELGVR